MELGDRDRRPRERQQRVRALVGSAAGVGRPADGDRPQRAGGLAAHNDALLPGRTPLARLEAQAGVVSGEPRHVRELLGAPLLVGDQQQGELGEQLGPLRELARDPDRQHHPALHVGGPRPVEPVALAAQRPVVVVADHRVQVPEQQQPAAPGPGDPGDQIIRPAGSRAGHPLEAGHGRENRRAHRDHLLGPAKIARRRGHRDQRLELALGPVCDFARRSRYELIHAA